MSTILMKPDTKWRDINMEVPKFGYHFIAMTPWGERTAINDGRFFGYTLTDCMHPLENVHLGNDQILSWRFIRKEDEDQFTNVILSINGKLKRPPFLKRLFYFFKTITLKLK